MGIDYSKIHYQFRDPTVTKEEGDEEEEEEEQGEEEEGE